MKKLISLMMMVSLYGCAKPATDLVTQPNVDLKQYAGTWYEQARLPNRFERDCVADVQANYVLNNDNTLQVTNQCRLNDGQIQSATGEGRLASSGTNANPAKLEVRFAPAWLSWLPMVWGDYWIMRLQGDYQYSLVGTPDREYLWVLSRAKQADKVVVQELLDFAASQGFDVNKVVFTAE